jgi:HAD superfamily hydrolase (TIGR01509 family)
MLQTAKPLPFFEKATLTPMPRLHQSRIPSDSCAELSNMNFFWRNMDLGRWFDFKRIIYDDGSRPGKPAPDVYLAAARNIGVAPADCLVIEDAITGIASAYAAGVGYIVAVEDSSASDTLRYREGVDETTPSLGEFPLERVIEQTHRQQAS